MRFESLEDPAARSYYVDTATSSVTMRAMVSSAAQYPHLAGLRPDLYRCFMEQTWRHVSTVGTIGLIHSETHFTDEKAGLLREATYRRLRRHWQFVNELKLFDIDNHVTYGVHVYGGLQDRPVFAMATSLYHPDTVGRSLKHEGSGQEPGLKDVDGHWDMRPHRRRITLVNDTTLATWHALLEDSDVPVRRTRMVYAVNASVAAALDRLSRAPQRIGDLGLRFSQGWNETTDFRRGYFVERWGQPDSWDDVILQGPHLFVATPMYKSPNKAMRSNKDWATTDFEALSESAIPITAYEPVGDRYQYDSAYTDWGDDDNPNPARDHYRVAWRSMAAPRNERTLISALIPPGAAQLSQSVYAAGSLDGSIESIVLASAFMSSLLSDFFVRSSPKSSVPMSIINQIPYVSNSPLMSELRLRILRLSCLTDAYAALWESGFESGFADCSWTSLPLGTSDSRSISVDQRRWSIDTPLRRNAYRRQALVELDALVALMLGVSADELCSLYRSQFAVLYGYDRRLSYYDCNGRLVPRSVFRIWRKMGDSLTLEDRTAANPAGNVYTYELPFVTLDREADMRQAYAEFERRLADQA